ncbi:hypothetical protein, partial [Antarcticimicrobium luteum]
MSRRPLIWTAGAGASVLVHGALAGLLLMAILPGPLEEQAQPETRLDVDAYQLERVAAAERQPQTEAAPEGEAQGAAVGAGAIPRNRAEALAPAAQATQPTPTRGQNLSPDRARPEPAVQPRPTAAPA